MGKHIALLRGINVGGNKNVDMAGLRALMTELGYGDVKTLLNSGNVVFAADSKPAATKIEKAITAAYGFDVTVILRTAAELKKLVDADPFGPTATVGSRFFVGFLGLAPAAGVLARIDQAAYEPELLHVGKREIYTWLPDGLIDSPLMKELTDKKLGVAATWRNWNTVTKLLALASG
ncbi:MAG: DUF1697 domain-containing protein [Actinomycetota bacterium]